MKAISLFSGILYNIHGGLFRSDGATVQLTKRRLNEGKGRELRLGISEAQVHRVHRAGNAALSARAKDVCRMGRIGWSYRRSTLADMCRRHRQTCRLLFKVAYASREKLHYPRQRDAGYHPML